MIFIKGIKRLFKRLLSYARSGEKADYQFECRATVARKEKRIAQLEAELKDAKYMLGSLASQVAQVRVSQAKEGRTGWEVMAYIPEDVVKAARDHSEYRMWLAERVLRSMIQLAIRGIVHVDSQGKVNALVFAPLDINGEVKAPEWVQALYEKDGQFKLSEKAWITPETEEQKIRRIR